MIIEDVTAIKSNSYQQKKGYALTVLNTLKEGSKLFLLAIWVTGFIIYFCLYFNVPEPFACSNSVLSPVRTNLKRTATLKLVKVRVNEEHFEVAKSKNKKLK